MKENLFQKKKEKEKIQSLVYPLAIRRKKCTIDLSFFVLRAEML